VARTAHDGTINSAHFIVSDQNVTDSLPFCFFILIQSKLQINIEKITTLNHAHISKFMSSAFITDRKCTDRK
jgi:hypothetical protein